MEHTAYRDPDQLETLQRRIGYCFNDVRLLQQALVHKSFANEHQLDDCYGNERLEFLGDAVIELVISHILMERSRDCSEGRLSKMRAAIVNTDCLANIARRYELSACLLLSRGEEENSGRTKTSILANTYEALAAAIYYDGGYDAVFKMISDHFREVLDEAARKGYSRDYKSRLQEFAQKQLNAVPVYQVVTEEGPDHYKTFESQVVIGGQRFATGRGGNKKAAEQQAAKRTLKTLEEQQ